MTNVQMKSKEWVFIAKIEGHAGFNPGNDIVCSAISMLTYTLAERVRRMEEEGKLRTMHIDLSDGSAKIAVTARHGHKLEMVSVMDTIYTGFLLLSDQYPDHVTVKYDREIED